MAPDSLNQLGKDLAKTQKEAQIAFKKKHPIRPSIERTRDIFDPDTSFEMFFNVGHTEKSVALDLEFTKPPPLSGCMTGGDQRGACEEFTLPAGDHEITLSNGMFPGTTSVFVNGYAYPASKWAVIETDPIGKVLVTQLPMPTNTVVVCYVKFYFTGICPNPTPSCHYPALNTICCGFLLGLLQQATSDKYGYVHYGRPGTILPTYRSPFQTGEGCHSSIGIDTGIDAFATKVENTVRFVSIGNGTVTPDILGIHNESSKGYEGWYTIDVWHDESSIGGPPYVQDYHEDNIVAGDNFRSIHVSGYPEICTHMTDLTFNSTAEGLDIFTAFWIVFGGFDWVLD